MFQVQQQIDLISAKISLYTNYIHTLWASYIIALLLLEVRPAYCLAWANEVNVSICSWSQLRANIIRDTIYLDGGNLWWQFGLSDGTYGSPFNDDYNEGYMYNLSLRQSFDQQTSMTALLQSMEKSNGVLATNLNPNFEDGTMLSNDNELILYGGLPRLTDSANPPPAEVILGYEAYKDSSSIEGWKPGFEQKSTNDSVTRYVTNGAGVSVPSENRGFYFSGMRGPVGDLIQGGDGSTYTTATSLITVNMTTMGNESWQNSSLPVNIPARANAEIVWLPVSESGILVVIGGVINPEILSPSRSLTDDDIKASETTHAQTQTSPTFMRELPIYDVASQNWYLQATTGNIPPQLTMFCSVMAPASDGTFNIYIYGGYDGISAGTTPSDDVYILSVPSFTWVKAYSGQSSHGRSGHKCIKVYPDKMFVLGGIYKNDPSICLDGGFLQVFNLNTLEFQDSYDPNNWSNYTVPSIVTDQIGGNTTGGTKVLSPSSWSDGSLSSIFAQTYTKPIATYYPYTSATVTPAQATTTPNSAVGTHATSSGGMKSGLKTTVVVSICIGVTCISLIIWLLRRLVRHRTLNEANLPDSIREDITPDNHPKIYIQGSDYMTFSNSGTYLTEEKSSRPQTALPEETCTEFTPITVQPHVDRNLVFELDTLPDKRIELPSEECEITPSSPSKSRRLSNLKICPQKAALRRSQILTSPTSIQNTPVEYQAKSPIESALSKIARLSPIYGHFNRRMVSTRHRKFHRQAIKMLIKESHVDVPTKAGGQDGTMRIYIFHPTIPGYPNARFPGVVVFSEIYQVTGPVARFARQIAGQGYICAAPSSYHEFTGPEALKYDAEDTDKGNLWKISKKIQAYDEDASLSVDYLLSLPTCNGRVGATGMCLGGHLAYRCALDQRVKAAVCYFATDIHSATLGEGKSDDSLKRAGDIKGELIMIFGKNDNHVPPEGRDLIRKTLHEKGVLFSFYEVAWAQHAFIRDELSKGRYDPAISKSCFEMLLELFNRTLKLDLGDHDGKKLEIEDVC
ncbi:putative carboxymethylenebutenolidase [Talaromyces pinophilus]|nr:putative carboxymethylenebutenolidase [Talaromyces pinophilus]